MEEALTVLEEAESLLKEEELAERDRAGESWASSVYLAKGRVLEALDSRPQVLLTLKKNKTQPLTLYPKGSRSISSCPGTRYPMCGSS